MKSRAAFLLPFVFFGMPRPSEAENNTWNIAALLCLSGSCATEGDNALRGAKLAVEQINQFGGVEGRKIKLFPLDSNEATSITKTLDAYKDLRQDKDIHFFVGPTTSAAALALAPLVKKDQEVVFILPTIASEDLSRSTDNMFMLGDEEAMPKAAAIWAYEKGIRKIAIWSDALSSDSSRAKNFEAKFTALGGSVTMHGEIPAGAPSSLSAQAQQLVKTAPDGIVIAASQNFPNAAKELRRLNYQGKKLLLTFSVAQLAEAEGSLEGALFFFGQQPTAALIERFKARNGGKIPDSNAATAFDAIYTFAKAVEKVHDFTPYKIKSALGSIDYPGSFGQINFNDDRVVKRSISAWMVENGKIVRMRQ